MNNIEQLKAIRAKCEELLAINSHHKRGGNASRANATFIAACAGPAEAGWRTTIAAIDALPTIVQQSGRIKRIHWGYDGDCGADGLACDCEDFANDAIKAILDAWKDIKL